MLPYFQINSAVITESIVLNIKNPPPIELSDVVIISNLNRHKTLLSAFKGYD